MDLGIRSPIFCTPKRPFSVIWGAKKGLWTPLSKNGYHFLLPTIPKNGDIDTCSIRISFSGIFWKSCTQLLVLNSVTKFTKFVTEVDDLSPSLLVHQNWRFTKFITQFITEFGDLPSLSPNWVTNSSQKLALRKSLNSLNHLVWWSTKFVTRFITKFSDYLNILVHYILSFTKFRTKLVTKFGELLNFSPHFVTNLSQK